VEEFAQFLDDLLGGVDLVAYSVAVGGLIWGVVVLRGWWSRDEDIAPAVHGCLRLVVIGALGLALSQGIGLAIKAWILAETLGRSPFPFLLYTTRFQAGLTQMLVAAGMAGVSVALWRRPRSRRRWLLALGLALILVVVAAWLTHAASRLDQRAWLMVLTSLHEVGAAIWVGGVIQIGAFWRLKRRRQALDALWPVVLARFSSLGIVAVLLLAGVGTALAWSYIGSWRGLFGTAYGAIVVVKLVLFATALGFAALNRHAVGVWARTRDGGGLTRRVPYFVEAETILLVALLVTASALTSQPPAVDTVAETASWAEFADVFTPRLPRISSPAHAAVVAADEDALGNPGTLSGAPESWSEYNHNMAGLFLVIMAVGALANFGGRIPGARHWPLGFIALGVFLFMRSDPMSWPLGPIPFWSSLFDGTVLQHRLATVLSFALGLFEWRARSPRVEDQSRRPYVFPLLCLAGGVLLLTHSHRDFVLKSEYLIQISHTAMGLLAILMACGRWLELRLAPPIGRVAGFGSIAAMASIGLILMFYQEPLAY